MTGPDGTRAPACIEAVYTTATPCGSCRQFLLEFATEDCVVHIDDGSANAGTCRLSDLLPRSFGREEQLASGGHVHDGEG
jgi:cytidine deaminase